ncbi:hypothetical protein [Sphingomonas mollis]|uniref:Transmembrane protein n=1 Tax=Sphingomonas mollis TaxID=2795726 RepID=A0ABS0XKK8_9SPHN|nr:hypothetical protein [Sphingomonas sp. BT553]MBJ6120360.1 hypothetical protein [Sphingomonas sp. BT553]
MFVRTLLLTIVFLTWRDGFSRRHPSWVEHATRWSMFAMLTQMLYLLVILPIHLLLYVIHLSNADKAADVIYLDDVLRVLVFAGIALMIVTGTQLAGFARTVMKKFEKQRWTALFLATIASGLFLYISYVTTMSTTMLDIRQGDNGILALFMVAWTLMIGRVCAVLFDRGRDSWDLGVAAFMKK